MNQEIKKRIIELKNLIVEHNRRYYNEDSPVISDAQFDQINKELQVLLDKNPEFLELIDQSDLLGSKLPENSKAKHSHLKPMLSLQNAFTEQDVIDFEIRVKRFLNINSNFPIEFCVEQKYDGLSFSALYINGKYVLGLTRGDGLIGEDITKNLANLANWPMELSGEYLPNKIEIRGEVFMPVSNFNKLNQILKENKEKLFINPRNAASGSLRVLDEQEVLKRGLQYFAYNIGYIDQEFAQIPNKQSEILSLLTKFGFNVSQEYLIGDSLDKIFEFYKSNLLKRKALDYEIDGLVIKVNSLSLQENLGHSAKYPRHSIAFKFPSNEEITRIIDVHFQVGRTGSITPVAILEPVNISGATITKASLHNFDEITKLDLKINDFINLKRSGDVIPQVISVIKDLRREDYLERIEILMPRICPSCSTELVKPINEVVLRCLNYHCQARVIEGIKYFCGRDALNIVGLGDKQVQYFYELGWIKNIVDIFSLQNSYGQQIKLLPNWGEKSSDNLFNNIEKSKNISLEKFIYCLGIRFVGEVGSKLLAVYFQRIANFQKFIESFSNDVFNVYARKILEELRQIDGLGEKMLDSLIDFFANKENSNISLSLIRVLKISEYVANNQNALYDVSNIFYQKNIVFTGTLSCMSRAQAKEIASEKLLAKVQSQISSSTDYLIAAEKSGSKLNKAQGLNIKIIDENEWLNVLDKCGFNWRNN